MVNLSRVVHVGSRPNRLSNYRAMMDRRQHAPLWGSTPSLTQCWSPFLTWLDWFIWSIGHPSHFFISTTETHIRALHGFFHLVWSKRARSLISQTKATMRSPEQRSIQEGSSQGGWCLLGCLSGHFQAQRRQILCPFLLQASRSLLLPAALLSASHWRIFWVLTIIALLAQKELDKKWFAILKCSVCVRPLSRDSRVNPEMSPASMPQQVQRLTFIFSTMVTISIADATDQLLQEFDGIFNASGHIF